MKKYLFLGVVGLGAIFLSGCSYAPDSSLKQSTDALEKTQQRLNEAVPVPEIKNSQTRKAIAERAKVFDSENKVTYVYLVNFGKVMAFYPVKGQVVSLKSYLTPVETIVNSRGTPCASSTINSNSNEPTCGASGGYIVSATDIDGTYGDNVDGIFFFTADTNAYVEWKGDYMVSDQPLKLSTTPELIREIK